MVILEALNALCRRLPFAPLSRARRQGAALDHRRRAEKRDGGRQEDLRSGRTCCCRASRNQPDDAAARRTRHGQPHRRRPYQRHPEIDERLVSRAPGPAQAVEFARFWFNSFDKLVGPKPAGLSGGEAATASLQSLVSEENLPGVDDEHAHVDHAERRPG